MFAQNSAFGQGNEAAVKAILGAQGATVNSVLVAEDVTEFTPFAQQVLAGNPDLVFVAWAGATSGAMWQAMSQQGVLDAIPVVTGLGDSATFGAYGEASEKISFLNHYFPGANDNEVNTAMIEAIEEAGGTPDLFSPDGFNAAIMIVQAIKEGKGDVDAMIAALEGFEFDGPKGAMTVRESDHALIQEMYQAKLVADGGTFVPELVDTAGRGRGGTARGAVAAASPAPSLASGPLKGTMSTPVPSALQIEGLGLQIGGATILKDVDLDVPAGSLVGVIGPNGAGKTTLFNVISGVMKPTSGRILMDGTDLTGMSVPKRARAGLGRTFQTSSLFPRLSVLENVRLAAQVAQGGNYSLLRFPRRSDAATEIARAKLEEVGLSHKLDTAAGDISHGDKRKLEIAVLLATDARIVLLDEPMAGVASGDVPGLVDNIRRMHAEKGCTVLMVEHHIDVLMGLVDKVAVMYFGTLIAFDTPQNVMANPLVQSAYLGTAA